MSLGLAVWIVAALALLVAAVAAARAGSAFRADLARHEARLAGGPGRLAETRLGPVEYAAAGSGRPVLVLHGTGGGFDQGLILARMLVGGGYGIVAPSRPGYLRTPLRPPAGPVEQAERHAALLDALGIDKAAVIGVSAGAYSAAELARRSPERVVALVLVVPAFGPTVSLLANFLMRVPFAFRALAPVADFGYWAINRLSRTFVLRRIGIPPEVEAAAPEADRAAVTEMIESPMPVSRRLAGVRNDAVVIASLRPPAMAEARMPVLIVCAQDDLLVGTGPALALARGAGQARLKTFASGGHLLAGRHSEARAAIAAFLNEAGWQAGQG